MIINRDSYLRMLDASALLKLEELSDRQKRLKEALRPMSLDTKLSLDELVCVTMGIAEFFTDEEIVKMSRLAYAVCQRLGYSFSHSFRVLFRAMYWERIGQPTEEVINKAYAKLL